MIHAAQTLLAAVAGGYVIGLVARTAGEVATWLDERRTDRLAR
jgi:hypothetical protein